MKLEVKRNEVTELDALRDYLKYAAPLSQVEFHRVRMMFAPTFERYGLGIYAYMDTPGSCKVRLTLGPGGRLFTGEGNDLVAAVEDALTKIGDLDPEVVEWAVKERAESAATDRMNPYRRALRNKYVDLLDQL